MSAVGQWLAFIAVALLGLLVVAGVISSLAEQPERDDTFGECVGNAIAAGEDRDFAEFVCR